MNCFFITFIVVFADIVMKEADNDKSRFPALDALTDEQLEKLTTNSYHVFHKKGEYVFSEGKPVSHLMFLKSGLVKIFKEGDTYKSVILKIIGSGRFVSLFSVFHSDRYQYAAKALENVEIIYVSLPLIQEIITENGKFALQLIQYFSNDGVELMNKLIYFPQKQVHGRIAEILLFFANTIYQSDNYTLPLSRQELADLSFSTKESVSRTLTEFRNDRIIEIDDRKVLLKSIDLLNILSRLG